MFIEPITLDSRAVLRDLEAEAESMHDSWSISPSPEGGSNRVSKLNEPRSAGLLGFTERVQKLIQELKWEDEQLLMTPRNGSGPRDEFSDSRSASEALASLRTQFSGDSGLTLASQANLFPETVMSLLSADFP
jgi:hypothetical protein